MERGTATIWIMLSGMILFLLGGCAADYPGPYRYQSYPPDSYYWYGYPPSYYGSPYGAGYYGWPYYWGYPDRYYRYPRPPHRHDDGDRKIIRPQPQPSPWTKIAPKSPPWIDAPVRKAPESKPVFRPEPAPAPPVENEPYRVEPRIKTTPEVPANRFEQPERIDGWNRK